MSVNPSFRMAVLVLVQEVPTYLLIECAVREGLLVGLAFAIASFGHQFNQTSDRTLAL